MSTNEIVRVGIAGVVRLTADISGYEGKKEKYLNGDLQFWDGCLSVPGACFGKSHPVSQSGADKRNRLSVKPPPYKAANVYALDGIRLY